MQVSHFIALHFTVLNRFFPPINCILCQLFSFYKCLETKKKKKNASLLQWCGAEHTIFPVYTSI